MEGLKLPHLRPDQVPWVTLSIGLVSARVRQGRDAAWFLGAADQALFQSKQEGRNRITAADPSEGPL